MILLVDVGNTTINVSLVEDNKKILKFKLNTDLNKTCDEYYLDFKRFVNLDKIKDAVIASVVPNITNKLITLFKTHLNIEPLTIKQGTKTGIKINTDNPKEVGADLVATSAAVALNETPTLIIDLGTATKYIYVKNKSINGVIITPGVEVSIEALVGNTALLPNIEINIPNKLLGTNTIECMQSGVTYGVAAQIDGLIDRIKKDVNEEFNVITTGGLSKLITPLINHNVVCNEDLIFDGLLKIYKLNKGR